MHFLKNMPSTLQRRKLAVSSSSHRRYWVKSLEAIHQDLFAAVDRWIWKDSLIWNIGANLGVFAFAAAVHAGAGGYIHAFAMDSHQPKDTD
jgi:hypothetical protein